MTHDEAIGRVKEHVGECPMSARMLAELLKVSHETIRRSAQRMKLPTSAGYVAWQCYAILETIWAARDRRKWESGLRAQREGRPKGEERAVIAIGKGSLGMTLPASWARARGLAVGGRLETLPWREGMEVREGDLVVRVGAGRA